MVRMDGYDTPQLVVEMMMMIFASFVMWCCWSSWYLFRSLSLDYWPAFGCHLYHLSLFLQSHFVCQLLDIFLSPNLNRWSSLTRDYHFFSLLLMSSLSLAYDYYIPSTNPFSFYCYSQMTRDARFVSHFNSSIFFFVSILYLECVLFPETERR